jgi:lipopolysaccharide transport system permease protein
MPPAVSAPVHTSSHHPALNTGPISLASNLYRFRHLIFQLTRRDVLGRYRGSHLGMIWSFLNPLLLLGIFTFVFKFIFRAKFTGHPSEGPADFALMLFAGLIIFNMVAECIARAPTLVLLNANYVTKIVFPLEILPVTVVLASLAHLLISLAPLLLGVLLLRDEGIPLTVVYWPLLLAPIICWSLGATWLLSALGVFLRDLNSIMLAVTTILMYASAVFYPIDRVPLEYQGIVRLNPLAFFSEESRNLTVWGAPLDWVGYGWSLLGGLIFMQMGYTAFMRTKHAFADVI